MPRKPPSVAKREALRDTIFPGRSDQSWPKKGGGGWFKGPRTLPILIKILNQKSVRGKDDLTLVYLELISRTWDEQIVQMDDPDVHAARCGFSKNRRRSWLERMELLCRLGFIEATPSGTKRFGFVRVVHPHLAVQSLRMDRPELVPDALWNELLEAAIECGDPIPGLPWEGGKKEPASAHPAPRLN